LGRSVAAMLLCAGTVFCLLTGLGSWMVGSPPPTWIDSRGLWIALLLVIGVVLIPFWWKLGGLTETREDSPA